MPHWNDLLAAVLIALPALLAFLTGRDNKKTITVILQRAETLSGQNTEIKQLVNGKLAEANRKIEAQTTEILGLKAMVTKLELRLGGTD